MCRKPQEGFIHCTARKIARALPIFAVGLLALVSIQPALAHIDPAGSSGNGITIEITAFRHDGVTPVIGPNGGFVTPCEQIFYQVTLRKAPSPNGAFEGGSWSLTTQDGVVHPLGAVPCIGGTTNDPLSAAHGNRGLCAGSPDHITSALVPYTISATDPDGADAILATTTLSAFFAHISTADTGGNFAGLGLPLTKQPCDDGLVCAPETCDTNAVGVCDGGSDVGDHCTIDADCRDGAVCDLTRTGGCTNDVVPPCADTGCVDNECDPAGTVDGNCDRVAASAPACTDTGCTDFECDPAGTTYNPNCSLVAASAPACTDTACTDFECDPAGTTYNPNCSLVAASAPACTDTACTDLECDPAGTTYNPNCNSVVATAPACTDTACTDFECDPAGTTYNPNCSLVAASAPACTDTACTDFECDPAGTTYNPNCSLVAASAPACTDSGCVDRECDPSGTTYNPNCDDVTNAPSCDSLGNACSSFACDDSGTTYNPNCDTAVNAPACDDTTCDHHSCVPGPAGTPYNPNCDGSTPIDPPPAACVPSEICRITGGGIVCQGQGQCCDPVSGDCISNTGSGGTSLTCLQDSDCDVLGDNHTTCTFCTTTEGGADIEKATFGGQVGAPFVTPGCHDNADCVQGNWTHQRHKKHGSLHGPDFYNMVCRCDQGDGTQTPGVCNPGDRENGPEPSAAPANIACFTGTGLWNPTSGRRTIPVAFRVEIEDRGEPGGGRNAGNLDDVYRIRIWCPGGDCGAHPDAAEAQRLAEAACCSNSMSTVTGNIGLPNIIDGGNLIHGNLQIHKLTGNPNNTNFPDQCFVGGGEPQ